MRILSLKERVSQISIGVFVLTLVLMLTCFTLYSMKKAKVAEELIINELSQNIESQSSQFVPSFLLPEQRQGIELMLQRLKDREGLLEAKVFVDASELGEEYSNCIPNKDRATSCTSNILNSIALIYPLHDSGSFFGYLLKSKPNNSPSSLKSVFELAGIIVIVLSVIFLTVYLTVTRLIARTLPMALDDLVKWIESDLEGRGNNQFKLPFQELEDLKFKIAEVMDKYNKSRDQAVIGQLTSGIMHDIRTPLQSIVTSMHLVEEQEQNSPKRLSRLENEHSMCSKNLPLILNIIETTLDGNRQIKINKQVNDLSDCISRVIEMNKDFARLREVSVISQCPPNTIAPHDTVQFLRVLSNLLKNSIEAAADSDTKLVKLTIEESDLNVLIKVEDSGHGIVGRPDNIFRAFQTSKARGTGLGLLITKKIVEAHGGKICASNLSSLGGALFEVCLPKFELGVNA